MKDKFKIPIAEIKSLKQNGLKSDLDGTCMLAGGFVGSIIVAASPKFFKNNRDQPNIIGYALLTIWGGAGLGNLLGSYFFRQIFLDII